MRTIFSARQPRAENKHSGFTIVELLIVVVVIAILATITIVAYNGITGQAVETTMKSDLQTNASGLEIDRTSGGSYPEDGSAANQGDGLKSSGDNSLAYVQKPYGYCVSATNPRSNKTFVVKSSNGQIVEGTCEAMVTTVTGVGTGGFTDGDVSSAQFGNVQGIDVDAAGNVYVADSYNYRVRKITPAGVVSTIAGSGTGGYADGPGATARFAWMDDITVDAAGNVFVADTGNARIRKITPAGVVSTWFVGAYSSIDIDASGTIYAYNSSNRIVKISSSGVVSTLAGSGAYGYLDGPGATAQFAFYTPPIPDGGFLTVDKAGTVYVADTGNRRIRKITPDGVVSTLAGSGSAGFADGAGASAQFQNLKGIAVDNNGTVYVADDAQGFDTRIRQISPSGVVSTLAGSGAYGNADGPAATAQFSRPRCIALDASGSGTVLYVSDLSRIREITQ